MRNLVDLKGMKFGRLEVISKEENRGSHFYWRCVCLCGTETVVRGSHLKAGT